MARDNNLTLSLFKKIMAREILTLYLFKNNTHICVRAIKIIRPDRDSN